jgi:SPP1 gp7 family putative phage head morphogenesis protein
VLTIGLAKGESVATIAHKISIAANGSNHALVVATTEAARAQTIGTFDIFRPAGITQFDWLAESSACPACLAKMAENPHPVGDVVPPLHPHCRCGTRAVLDTGSHVGTHALVGS